MSDEKGLMTLQETMTLGDVLVKSGYFKDARDASQAVVKVLAGREMGFGPIASMQGINIIQGQPSIGSNLLGAAIKRTNKYNYRIVGELTNDRAEIAFFENGQEVGRSVFTMEDAERAGLNGKQNWRQYPRNMLFSRAMSNGARWYCPDVFGGVTPYTWSEEAMPSGVSWLFTDPGLPSALTLNPDGRLSGWVTDISDAQRISIPFGPTLAGYFFYGRVIDAQSPADQDEAIFCVPTVAL